MSGRLRNSEQARGHGLDEPTEEGLDTRLLVPAVLSWVACAATLAAAPRTRLAMGLMALLGAVLTSGTRRPRGLPTGTPRPCPTGAMSRNPCGSWRLSRKRSRLGRTRRGPTRASPCPLRSAVAFTLAVTAMCLTASGLHGQLRASGRLSALADAGATARLLGSVASDPRTLARSSKGRDDLVLVRVRVRAVEWHAERSGARADVLVFGDRRWLAAHWGQRVEARGRLAPADPADDVVATMTARGPPLRLRQAGMLGRSAERLRAGLRHACAGLSADARGLLPGLVVGDTSLQPPGLGEDMKATGLTHLAAVSGT